jgi:hypothetical protein
MDVGVNYKHVQVIICDIQQGSVERSIDVDKEGIP